MTTPAVAVPADAAGKRIAELRRAATLSQPELAARAGVSISTVYRAERGDPSLGPRMVARIAAALAVEPDEICSSEVLLRGDLPLSARRAEEQHGDVMRAMDVQHEEVMRSLEDIQASVDKCAGR